MGMAYRVNFKRRYNSIFSCAACGHAWELFIIFFTFVATVWAMTLVDFNDPKAGNAVYLISQDFVGYNILEWLLSQFVLYLNDGKRHHRKCILQKCKNLFCLFDIYILIFL